LNKLHGFNHLKVFPNGVDLSTFKSNGHDYTQNNVLLFTGYMNYAPNVDAVLYFAKDIFPLLQKQFPNLRFVIAGQKPVEAVLNLAGNGVEVTGFVENMADWYKKAAIVVAPLRFGAGTQNKVLEAMAMGVPVVCSKIGFEGLGITSGEGAFLGENMNSFADQIKTLILDVELRQKTGELGKEVVRSKFDWDSLATLLNNYLTILAHGKN
jgi:glycosyltransferase involved in cell wall biosynthesis